MVGEKECRGYEKRSLVSFYFFLFEFFAEKDGNFSEIDGFVSVWLIKAKRRGNGNFALGAGAYMNGFCICAKNWATYFISFYFEGAKIEGLMKLLIYAELS